MPKHGSEEHSMASQGTTWNRFTSATPRHRCSPVSTPSISILQSRLAASDSAKGGGGGIFNVPSSCPPSCTKQQWWRRRQRRQEMLSHSWRFETTAVCWFQSGKVVFEAHERWGKLEARGKVICDKKSVCLQPDSLAARNVVGSYPNDLIRRTQ